MMPRTPSGREVRNAGRHQLSKCVTSFSGSQGSSECNNLRLGFFDLALRSHQFQPLLSHFANLGKCRHASPTLHLCWVWPPDQAASSCK